LWNRGYFLYLLPPFRNTKGTPEFSDALFSLKKINLKSDCYWGTIDYSGIFFASVESLLKQDLYALSEMIGKCEHELMARKPSVLGLAAKTNTFEFIIATIAQHRGLPVISWQHGAYGHHDAPIMLYSEYMNSDFHFSWGQGVTTAMKNDPTNIFPCTDIPIGSYQLERIFFNKTLCSSVYSIVYVTTGYQKNNFYVSFPIPFHDNALWQMQKNILDILGATGKKSVFKLHPGEISRYMFCQYITSRSFKNIELIINELSFLELMRQSDIVIIDFPSTSLLQAIAARKIIFLVMGTVQLKDEAMNLLKKRVFYCKDTEELKEMLTKYLNGQSLDQNPDPDNTEFLVMYGTHILDGRIPERAIGALEMIRGKTQK
jgi:hypothetical protein